MKAILLSLFIFIILDANCQYNNEFVITGRIHGLKDGDEVFLYKERDTTLISHSLVRKETFQLKFKTTLNGVFFTIKLMPKDELKPIYFAVLLDQSNVIIEGGIAQLANLKVVGSKSHNELKEFKALTEPYIQKMGQDNKDLSKEGVSIPKQIHEIRLKFIAEHPSSAYTPYLIKTTSRLKDDEKRREYSRLTETARNSFYGNQLKEMLDANLRNGVVEKDTSIGAMAPDFSSYNLNGEIVQLYDIIKKSKITLLDFWASWCLSCREENPYVREVYTNFHDKGLNILSVSFDFKEKFWKDAIEKDTMPWFHVSDLKGRNATVQRIYGINGIPDNFLIGNDGKILARNLRGEQLYRKIKEILENINENNK